MSPPLSVTLYRKAGCGLCDQAEEMLARIALKTPLAVTTIDIDSDPALQARYLLEIPVVAVDGTEVARAPISEVALRNALRRLLEAAGS